ncbi:MAG: hypothetical protein ACRES4_01625 [Nevskiales bacterium]
MDYWLDGLATGIIRRDSIAPGNFCAGNLVISPDILRSVINQFLAKEKDMIVTDETPMGAIALLALHHAFPCGQASPVPRAGRNADQGQSGASDSSGAETQNEASEPNL